MANSEARTGICLYALAAREEAVVKRVITFSEAQGRSYGMASIEEAGILVVSDDTAIDAKTTNPSGCVIVRIANPGVTQSYDVLMQRPLLVTKVMRSLDEANSLLQGLAADTTEIPPVSTPTPVSGLYAQIIKGAACAAPATPVATPSEEAVAESGHEEKQAKIIDPPVLVEPSTATEESVSDEQATDEVVASPVSDADKVAVSPAFAVEVDTTEVSVDVDTDETQATVATPNESAEPDKVVPAVKQTEPLVTDEIQSDASAADTSTGQSGGGEDIASAEALHHRALVVDDSAAIRKQLELELRTAGISADFAETGEQALEKVDQNDYDLIFLDIIMPGIDGYETCRQMRTRATLKKMPIIMLSAKTSPLDEVQGVIAGASTYLTKPVKSEQLQKTLKRVSMWLDNFQVSV